VASIVQREKGEFDKGGEKGGGADSLLPRRVGTKVRKGKKEKKKKSSC